MTPKFLKFDTIKNPTTGRMLEYVDKRPAIMALVLDYNWEKGLFVNQYRSGSQSQIYECPAGVIDDTYSPIETVYKELREEIGLEKQYIDTIENVGEYYSSVGWTNEVCYLYIVTLKSNFELKEQMLDEEECLTYKWVDLNDFENLFCNNPIPIKTAMLMKEYELKKLKNLHTKKQKICIFGGSFNPVTNLHMSMAERVIDELGIDKFIFEPVGDRYGKDNLISSKYRHEMLKKAVENSENEKLEVGDYEISQFVQPTTMHTLTHYKELYPDAEIYFMVGSDNLKLISGWANNEMLLKDFQMVCIQREGDDNIYQDIILNDIYLSKHHKRIHILYENATNNISSTKVRNLVKADKSITWLVPPHVKKYIKENNLYKD